MILSNNGFVTLGSRPSPSSPIVVVGTARGGTSMVAGVLHNCGVFCGNSAHPPVYEDLVLSNAFEQNDFTQVSIVSEKYSKTHDIWAWKRPSSVNYLWDVHRLLENPSYIFVFRDILSIANRNHLSMNTQVFESMQRALNDYNLVLDFLSQTNVHELCVSYEKAIQSPAFFVDEIIKSFHLGVSEEQRAKAIDFVEPNKTDYILKSTIKIPHDFDPETYLNLHEDVKQAGVDPLEHYLKHGLKEGRSYKK